MWFSVPAVGGLAEPTPANVGAKAAGLLALPAGWTPKTLFLSPSAHDAVRKSGYAKAEFDAIFAPLTLRYPLEGISSLHGRLLVRSDAVSETISERGTYSSLETLNDIEAIKRSAEEIWTEADRLGSREVGLILQPLLARRAHGHLSNEQRLNRETASWTVEFFSPRGHESMQWRVSERDETGDHELACGSRAALQRRLRAVAAYFSEYSPRHHLEWVWDGMRVWVVQADPVPPLYGPPPGELWRPRVGPEPSGRVTSWVELTSGALPSFDEWPKIRALANFSRAGLPIHQVWCMTETDWLPSEEPPPAIRRDLELLTSGHTVIRTDVAGRSASFMLPKTKSAVTDASEALRFMREAVEQIRAEDHNARIAFLAHRFLRSRSSAWSYAAPGSPIVTIDAIWGLADGLGWLPHDKFVVDLRTGEIRHSVNAKTHFLDVTSSSGAWEYRETPTDWIWRSSVTESHLVEIANGAWDMAQETSEPQLTMWFVNLLDGQRRSVLPWFQASHAVPLDDHPPGVKGRNRFYIRSETDLAEWLSRERSTEELIVLEPGDSLLRDKDFVARIASSSKVRGACIEISGSPLAHPYYLLTKAGATVICPLPPPVEARFEKLVRDQVPETIQLGGEHASILRSSGSQLEELLREKLVEEAFEVALSTSTDDLVQELADLDEVVRALRSATGVTARRVEDARTAKLRKRGGFDHGIVLRRTSSRQLTDATQTPLPGFELLSSPDEAIEGSGSRGVIRLNRLKIGTSARRSISLPEVGVIIHFEVRGREIRFNVEATASSSPDRGGEDQPPLPDSDVLLGYRPTSWP